MATRSFIIQNIAGKAVRGIYCHWDGYPEATGRTLQDHYTDDAKISRLMDLGFLSSLGEETDPDTECDHTYDTPQPGVCVAHIRDRGESPEISATESFENLTDALECAEDMNCDYAYSWDGCKWTCHDLDAGTMQTLEDVLRELPKGS